MRDVEGKAYIDYLIGSGPMFAGHAHPAVVAAVQAQVARGSTFFANNEYGIMLAEAICEAVPCAEKVRYTSSGSEATHYAMRLARAYRGRDKILKFEGGFHGMGDWALMSMAPKQPGNFPQAIPDTAGVPSSLKSEMLIAPFNDAETAVAMIMEHADELAGVIVEPLQRLDPAESGVPAGAAQGDRRRWHSADLRRDRDRLPLRLWRRARALRRDSGPVHPRQDRRRRLSACCGCRDATTS